MRESTEASSSTQEQEHTQRRCPGWGEVRLVWNLVKVVLLAGASRWALYQVVASLTLDVDSMQECTKHPCNYVRIFPGRHVPGTGARIIRVQNGMERPLFIQPVWSGWYYNYSVIATVGYSNDTAVDLEPVTLQQNTLSNNLTLVRNQSAMEGSLQNASKEIPSFIKYVSFIALQVCRTVQESITVPSERIAAFIRVPAFERLLGVGENLLNETVPPIQLIPSGYTYNGSDDSLAVETYCRSSTTKKQIRTYMDEGMSKRIYIISVGGWLAFTVLHDWFLIIQHYRNPEGGQDYLRGLEQYSLLLGAVAFFFHTAATGSCFSWSSGALSIFVAPGPKEDLSQRFTTVCFYKLPTLRAFFALSTPLYLLYTLMGQTQLIATSFARGDFIYTEKYQVPFLYVANAASWKEGKRLLDDVQSPHKHSKLVNAMRMQMEKHMWKNRQRKLLLLDYWFLIVQVLVISPAGMHITASAIEYAITMLNSNLTEDLVQKWIIMLGSGIPSLLFVVLGFLQVYELVHHCFLDLERKKAISVADLLRPIIIVICWAAGYCLWPWYLVTNPPQHLDLFWAELWGNGGISLFLFGISALSTNLFSIREAMKEIEKNEQKITKEDMKKELDDVQAEIQWMKTEGKILGEIETLLQAAYDKEADGSSEEESDGCTCQLACAADRNERVWCVCGRPGCLLKCSGTWHHELVSLAAFNPDSAKSKPEAPPARKDLHHEDSKNLLDKLKKALAIDHDVDPEPHARTTRLVQTEEAARLLPC